MPLNDSEFNTGSDVYSMPLSDLRDAVIGVEATSYLQQMIDEPPSHEPLLAALGGDPIGMRQHIENELDKWKSHGLRPLFVFEGQSVVGKDDITLSTAKAALSKTQTAWNLYADNHPEEAVKSFGASGAVRSQDLYRILQEVLAERDLDFKIAPYNACAQLAYMDMLDEQYIDGIMGSKELLLYNINDVVINPPTASDWESKTFYGISKVGLMAKLNINADLLADALLMSGTSFLTPFPVLGDPSVYEKQPFSLLDAVNNLKTNNKSVTTTCSAFHEELRIRGESGWLDKYRKAKMLVKHCVTVSESGQVHIKDYEHLTGDNVEYLGLQVAPELYHYLSKALIGPRILNCFSHLQAVVFPTLDGVVSDEYKRLVTRTLIPVKETTAALISSRIHRAFLFKDITVKFWFDNGANQTLIHRNMQPQTNQQADTWGVKDADLKSQESAINMPAGKLSFAVLSLKSKEFSPKTITKDKITGLNSKSEIISNVLWRHLHLRGYINDQHELTAWGRALAATLQSIAPAVEKYKDIHHIEEAAFLAFELIQFDNLNSRNRHSELIGGPLRGSDEDKANCILIGRTACLLKLRHLNIGYTGPLSKNFLAFHSVIKAVRETDRDLLEAIIASMLLNNQANRSRDDYQELGSSLPFSNDVDTGLGIAVKTYLDDFLKLDWTPEERESNKAQYVERYLPHSINFKEDLDVAFKFFDAVYEGVKTLGDEMTDADKKAWHSAKAYLEKRR